jgi:hypothetical protein
MFPKRGEASAQLTMHLWRVDPQRLVLTGVGDSIDRSGGLLEGQQPSLRHRSRAGAVSIPAENRRHARRVSATARQRPTLSWFQERSVATASADSSTSTPSPHVPPSSAHPTRQPLKGRGNHQEEGAGAVGQPRQRVVLPLRAVGGGKLLSDLPDIAGGVGEAGRSLPPFPVHRAVE